jgi:putative oxidoreductase
MKKLLSTKYSENSWHTAILILRLAVGLLMLKHGIDKLSNFNVQKNSFSFIFGAPTDYIMVIFAELFCSIFLVLGLFTRFALIPLIITMAVAFFKAHKGVIFGPEGGENALLYLVCYVTLLFTGPGKVSIDKMIAK